MASLQRVLRVFEEQHQFILKCECRVLKGQEWGFRENVICLQLPPDDPYGETFYVLFYRQEEKWVYSYGTTVPTCTDNFSEWMDLRTVQSVIDAMIVLYVAIEEGNE